MYERRRRIWELYDSYLTDTGLDLPSLPESHSAHARHLYVVGLPSHVDRDEFIWRASHDYGITMGVHYKSVPTFSAYKHIWNSSDIIANFPIALEWGHKTISLSLSAAVSDEDVERIVECTKRLIA